MINYIFKFSLSIIFLIFSLSILFAQNLELPVVFASGGNGKNVFYKKLTKKERDNIIGYVWNDCSSCLASEDCNIFTSSTLNTQGAVSYIADNMQDDDPTTAWVEGDTEYGIGQYLEITTERLSSKLIIYNGYQKSPKTFIENSRVKSLRVSENGIDRCIIRLKDEMGRQLVTVEELGLMFNQNGNSKLTFTIMEVYEGTKFKDVAISEFFSNGCCVSGESKILLSTNKIKNIKDIKVNDSIILIDNNDKIIYGFKIELGRLVHERVLEISTANGSNIFVTPNHFVYSGRKNQKIQAGKLTFNDSLVVFEGDHKIILEKIAKIIIVDKPIETFYFKNIEFGNQNIAWPVKAIFNNIITDDEYLDKLNKLNKSVN
jgi:hypothetical protein